MSSAHLRVRCVTPPGGVLVRVDESTISRKPPSCGFMVLLFYGPANAVSTVCIPKPRSCQHTVSTRSAPCASPSRAPGVGERHASVPPQRASRPHAVCDPHTPFVSCPHRGVVRYPAPPFKMTTPPLLLLALSLRSLFPSHGQANAVCVHARVRVCVCWRGWRGWGSGWC